MLSFMTESRRFFAAFVVVFCVGCAARRPIALEDIARIETEKKFTVKDGELTPAIEQGTVVAEGERLKEVLRGAQCKEGNAEWTEGVPAMLTFKVGTPIRADGFRAEGRVLKVHPNQWCQLTEEGWRALWAQ